MKKRIENGELRLGKFKIAKLNNLNTIKGGSDALPTGSQTKTLVPTKTKTKTKG